MSSLSRPNEFGSGSSPDSENVRQLAEEIQSTYNVTQTEARIVIESLNHGAQASSSTANSDTYTAVRLLDRMFRTPATRVYFNRTDVEIAAATSRGEILLNTARLRAPAFESAPTRFPRPARVTHYAAVLLHEYGHILQVHGALPRALLFRRPTERIADYFAMAIFAIAKPSETWPYRAGARAPIQY